MRKSIILCLLTALWSLTSCVNDGGQVFGVLPDGVAATGDKLDVESATYDGLLHELRITWKGTAPSKFKGVEVSFPTLSGEAKTIRILTNSNFPDSYNYFTIATKNPEQASFRYIWNEDNKESLSDKISVADLSIKKELATKRFVTMKAPVYTYEPIPNLDGNHDEVVEGYDALAGNTDAKKSIFFTNLLKTVLSAAYNSTTDAGEQPVRTLKCKVSDMSTMGGVYAYVINYSDASGGPEFDLAYNILSAQVNSGSIDVPGWEGVCKHEFTHLIQAIPAHAATESDRMMMQEGYADAIRTATGGFTDSERLNNGLYAATQSYYDENRKDGDLPIPYIWQSKYQTSGNFMAWLRCYDGDFLRKLTASAKKIDKDWTLETAVKYIFGDNIKIKDLWDEYIRDVQTEAGK